MLQETLLNAEGYKELQDELENLKTVGRKKAAEKIKVARSYGDLSENAEYDEAMSDQAKLEARINELENMLKNAKVFDESSLSKDVIHIGSNVVIVDDKKNELENGYLLSTKDLNTLEHIGELIEAGIDSLKIEGRMKRPEYVYYVTSLYRKAIDSYYKNKKVEICS